MVCQGLGAARPVEVQADRCLSDKGEVNDPELAALAGDHRELTVDKIQVTESEGQQFSVANLCGKEKDHDGIVAGPVLGGAEPLGGIVAPEKHHLFVGENLVIGPGLQLAGVRDQAGETGEASYQRDAPREGSEAQVKNMLSSFRYCRTVESLHPWSRRSSRQACTSV